MHKLRYSALALVLWITSSASAGVRVVSDIDDTAKITDVGDPIVMVLNGLFGKRAFAGMRELYSAFALERKYEFDYVSGSPTFLRSRIRKFLKDSGFPEGEIFLKPFLGRESLRAYKLRVIRELMDKNPGDVFILIGDDTQSDYEVYDELFRYAPDRILSIYIRQVTDHKLPPSAFSFLTAFDIVRTEYIFDRLTVSQAAPVALAILAERRDSRIIPAYSYCPTPATISLDPLIEKWAQDIDARVRKICIGRESIKE